jgi:hypothetical protein
MKIDFDEIFYFIAGILIVLAAILTFKFIGVLL